MSPDSSNAVVEHYQNEISNKIKSLNTSDLKNRSKLHDSLVERKIPQDIINFYFDNKHLQFEELLIRDEKVKVLIIIHLMAIIFHCLKIMQSKKLQAPKFFAFSGRGSKYLNLLDPNHNLTGIKNLFEKITEKMFGKSFDKSKGLNVIFKNENVKELTCFGGIYYHAQNSFKEEVPYEIFIGDEFDSNKLAESYNTINENNTLKEAIKKNVIEFIELLIKIENELDYSKFFGVNLKIAEHKSLMESSIIDGIDKGIQMRMNMSGKDAKINETLFFYPITEILFTLSKKLYDNKQQQIG